MGIFGGCCFFVAFTFGEGLHCRAAPSTGAPVSPGHPRPWGTRRAACRANQAPGALWSHQDVFFRMESRAGKGDFWSRPFAVRSERREGGGFSGNLPVSGSVFPMEALGSLAWGSCSAAAPGTF